MTYDSIESWVVEQWPILAVIFGALAVGIMILRWIAPRTKTTIDDEVVEKADKMGITNFLSKYNPFRKK